MVHCTCRVSVKVVQSIHQWQRSHLLLLLDAALVGSPVRARASRFKARRLKPDVSFCNRKLEIVRRCKRCWISCRRRKQRIGQFRPFTVNGQTFPGAARIAYRFELVPFNDWQKSIRVDHRFNDNHTLNGRYIYQDQDTVGAGQSHRPVTNLQTCRAIRA